MTRRRVIALLLAMPLSALASSPDEAKKQPKPKPQPPPEDKGPGKPRGGDKRAPVVPDTRPELPGGKFYKYPRSL